MLGWGGVGELSWILYWSSGSNAICKLMDQAQVKFIRPVQMQTQWDKSMCNYVSCIPKCWISLPYVNAWCWFACVYNNTRKKMIVPAHHSHQILCYSTEQLLEWKLNSLLSHRHTVAEGQGEYGGNLSFYLVVMWWHWHLSILSCHCCPNLELKNYHNLIVSHYEWGGLVRCFFLLSLRLCSHFIGQLLHQHENHTT